MALKITKPAAATAVAAALCLLATPVAAVDLPRPATVDAYDADAGNVQRNGRRHRDWDDDDIDAEDVIVGALIIGGLAAIFGAAKRANQQPVPQPAPYPDDAGYRAPDGDSGYQGSGYQGSGIDRAVDICVGEVERDQGRVGSVDAASRSADGWHVSGALEGGAPFSCSIGNDGRVSAVEVGAYEAGFDAEADGEWNDEDYAKGRESKQSIDGNLGYEVAKAP